MSGSPDQPTANSSFGPKSSGAPKTPLPTLQIGQCATLACLLEVSAPKPGNVHRGADFEDVRFDDFVLSAVAIGPAMEQAGSQTVGQTVRQAVTATRQVVQSNTNLGIILLLSPLAAVPRNESLQSGVQRILGQLTSADSADVYAAIRLAQPGGMRRPTKMDIAGEPPANLLPAMQFAARWDLVARQYVTGFETLFRDVVPWLLEDQSRGLSLIESIVHTYLRLLAQEPDSLIARKCGEEVATHVSRLAAATLESGVPGSEEYQAAVSDLDFWLRSDGHRRNPGTTADLITAGLFIALRDGQLRLNCSSK